MRARVTGSSWPSANAEGLGAVTDQIGNGSGRNPGVRPESQEGSLLLFESVWRGDGRVLGIGSRRNGSSLPTGAAGIEPAARPNRETAIPRRFWAAPSLRALDDLPELKVPELPLPSLWPTGA